MAKIEIYTTTYCGYCVQAKSFLKSKGLPFTEIDVTGDDAARHALVEKSGGRRTVPQIFINDEAIGGYTDLVALDRNGKLESLLAVAGG
jgi:glutaredoxin 3